MLNRDLTETKLKACKFYIEYLFLNSLENSDVP